MWIGFKDGAGDYVIDPINISRTTDFADLRLLKGEMASSCIEIIDGAITDLTPRSKFETWKMRFTDAKQHTKKILVRKIGLGQRLSIVLESLDILLGIEDFWIPSSQTTVATLDMLKQLCQNCPGSIIDVV